MTPDQLTRLTLLLSMATLTGSENQELAFLQSIATPAELASAAQESDEDDDDDDAEQEDDEEDEEQPPAPAPKAGKPSAMDHAKALASSKASLVRRNTELSAQAGRLTAQVAQLTATISENATKLAALQTELATLKGELTQAKAANKTLSAKVSDELAGLGVGEKNLPSAAKGKGDDASGPANEDEVKTSLEAATTFEEKAAILEAWEKKNA